MAKKPAAAAADIEPPKPKVGYTANALDEAMLGSWKTAHIAVKRADAALEFARDGVNEIFVKHSADFIESSLGTFARQHRDPGTKVDWKAVAIAGIAEKKLAKLVAEHSTPTAGHDTPEAPKSWGIEAKAAS